MKEPAFLDDGRVAAARPELEPGLSADHVAEDVARPVVMPGRLRSGLSPSPHQRRTMVSLGRGDNLVSAQATLARIIAQSAERVRARLLVGPSPHDGHHAHEVVGRAVRDAVEVGDRATDVLLWGLWAELALPNRILGFGAPRLSEIDGALRSHAGELRRNRYDRLLAGRASAAAVLGPERVFGYGAAGITDEYAELLTHVRWSRAAGWRLTQPRGFDAADPLAGADGPTIGWWLHARSVQSRVAEADG